MQARDQEVGEARMQLARLIRELEGARGEGERMLRRMRALEGQEQVKWVALTHVSFATRPIYLITVSLRKRHQALRQAAEEALLERDRLRATEVRPYIACLLVIAISYYPTD